MGEFEILRRRGDMHRPLVSIITPASDRLDRLCRCIESVRGLGFKNYEHVVVVDGPPRVVLEKIASVVADKDRENQRVALATLNSRRNDFGITPSAVGLSLAAGKYICFLTEENGYLPTHFDRLVPALEDDPRLGFVYTPACMAGGGRSGTPTRGQDTSIWANPYSAASYSTSTWAESCRSAGSAGIGV